MYDSIIIGGGPAGMMAAIAASQKGSSTALLEKNNELGAKLLITGKGRCNVTNTRSVDEIIEAFGLPQSQFLYSTFRQFSNFDIIEFFESRGVKLVEERGQRIFPENGQSQTILRTLKTELRKQKVQVLLNSNVTKISLIDTPHQDQKTFRIYIQNRDPISAKKIIIATGGKSYPGTGSTGDGYRFGSSFGHTILPIHPALVPLVVTDVHLRRLTGLTLKNVTLNIKIDNQVVASQFGEMLFTHLGISGPIVLTLSKIVGDYIHHKKQVYASLDLKPALTIEQLQKRLQREQETIGKKEYTTLLIQLLPKALIEIAVQRTGIAKNRKIGSLNNQEKQKIISFLKNFDFQIEKTFPLESGIITAGGIDPNELNQKTMESKLIPNLYFAGEVIGLDGPTGGYNLTKAFSTGHTAGDNL